jgi:uncharacterized membrane protein YgdD (TMEM256/DUF423 family)
MRPWIVLAGLSGATAVVVGAVAAHGVGAVSAQRLDIAARYQMWHALALLAVAWLTTTGARRWAHAAGALFLAGIVLFCGSLELSVVTGSNGVTVAAPVGGTAFILGWLALVVAGLRSKG